MTDPDDLNTALAEPVTIIAGNPVGIKPLTIMQLPKAAAIATRLFGSETVDFNQADFLMALDEQHINLMIDLIALMADCPKEQLDLPIADFMLLFNAALTVNEDFFLTVIGKAKPATTIPITTALDGPTSCNGSEVTGIQTPSD